VQVDPADAADARTRRATYAPRDLATTLVPTGDPEPSQRPRDLPSGVRPGVDVPASPHGRDSVADPQTGEFPVTRPPLGGPVVVRLSPMRSSPPSARDGSGRFFPDLAFERVIPFLTDHAPATIHAASNDPRVLAEGSAGALLLDRVVLVVAAIIDNQRVAEQSLRALRFQVIQSEKLASLGQIAAGIVHELNNPLTTIVAYSDFLRRKLASRGEAADVERLSRINEAAERILRFSRDLTAYSRPSNEAPAPVSIHDVIDRALVFCEHEIEKTGVSVERDFSEVRAVRGVAGQLTQVFVNLFTNAAHAMRTRGGMLTIATVMSSEPEAEVTVTVTDDGHGISDQDLAHVFDPFFTTKTDGSGTGLGLSIVRSIVQTHGGRIAVRARVPRGTIFQVDLPVAPRAGHDDAPGDD
jgi:two-component system, NtrC family, sensor kinase